jgi:hypothetical protein
MSIATLALSTLLDAGTKISIIGIGTYNKD